MGEDGVPDVMATCYLLYVSSTTDWKVCFQDPTIVGISVWIKHGPCCCRLVTTCFVNFVNEKILDTAYPYQHERREL